jgi:hypothetical protein
VLPLCRLAGFSIFEAPGNIRCQPAISTGYSVVDLPVFRFIESQAIGIADLSQSLTTVLPYCRQFFLPGFGQVGYCIAARQTAHDVAQAARE